MKSSLETEKAKASSNLAIRENSNEKNYQITCSEHYMDDGSEVCSPKSYNFNIEDSDHDAYDGLDSLSDQGMRHSS